MGYFFAIIEKKGSGSQMTYDFEISEVTTKKLPFIFLSLNCILNATVQCTFQMVEFVDLC